ncbi:hypothetical protein K0A97_01020 [Patescibacteria group bacterium]|nr:hypothetical protein [Patescibacteria group bacterium]
MQLRIKEETHLAMTKLKKQLLLDSYDDVIWHFIEAYLPLSKESENLRREALDEFKKSETTSFDKILAEHEKN